jgi:hypothetical protein
MKQAKFDIIEKVKEDLAKEFWYRLYGKLSKLIRDLSMYARKYSPDPTEPTRIYEEIKESMELR